MSEDVVTLARQIIRMDDELARARGTITQLQGRIEEQRAASLSAADERMKLLNRIFAVTRLHAEATAPSCGDGCCHEGLGVCEYCDEPYPCRTARAAGDRE